MPAEDVDEMIAAALAMGFNPDATVDLRDEERTDDGNGVTWHRHVALEWEGGLIWLDMSEQQDHFCVDVRQFREGERVRMGVFAIEDGRGVDLNGTLSGARDPAVPQVLGHRAVTMPILLTEKAP